MASFAYFFTMYKASTLLPSLKTDKKAPAIFLK